MKNCQVVVIVAGIAVVAALLGYVGFIIWMKLHPMPNDPPHIILIVVDDLGWNDVSFHGANEIHTPNIDALAYNGVILNRHYVMPSGTPSRTSLMTGRYAIRDGLQGVPTKLDVTFMPKFLRDLGYETKLLGKWDLGHDIDDRTPMQRGFDYFFGYHDALICHCETDSESTKNKTQAIDYVSDRDEPNNRTVTFSNTEDFTDLITDEAEKIIKNHGNEKPIFIQISHLATATSLGVRNSTGNDETFAYIEDKSRRRYAGIIKAMDESVGRVVKALSDAQMLKNSIIVFMSGSGAANPGSNYPLRGSKNTLFEGGIRGIACIFSPLLTMRQKLSDEYVHVTDWLPTLYTAAGGNVSDLGEIDGVDQWQSLAYNGEPPRRDMLLNVDELQVNEAAIVGRYKLVKVADESIDGYYGDTGNSTSCPMYNVTDALNSRAGRAIRMLDGFFSSTRSKARKLHERAVVRCQRSLNYSRCAGTTCLFDIVSDPCETRDLSKIRTDELTALKSFVDWYRQSCSYPQYSNGSRIVIRKDYANSSTIVPENSRGNDTMKDNASMHNVTMITSDTKNNTENSTSIAYNNTIITSNVKNNTKVKHSLWNNLFKFPIKIL